MEQFVEYTVGLFVIDILSRSMMFKIKLIFLTIFFLKSRLNHACREGYYQEMLNISEEAVKRSPNEPIFKFYRAISLVMSKRTNEALRALEPLQHETPVQLGACLASITAHKACVQVDREAVASLEARNRDSRKSASSNVKF